MKNRIFLLISLSILLTLITTQSGSSQADSPHAAPTTPINIKCMGWEEDTVVVSWEDKSDNETEFRVERSDNGGAWSEIATVAANTGSYNDTGVDVSNQGHRYRVRAV